MRPSGWTTAPKHDRLRFDSDHLSEPVRYGLNPGEEMCRAEGCNMLQLPTHVYPIGIDRLAKCSLITFRDWLRQLEHPIDFGGKVIGHFMTL